MWDGNEVWLLTAGGALFAAFPDAYATTFSGFYLAVMLVLFGLIVRAVSFEFRAGDPSWGKLWDACFFVGSLLPALLLGVAVGNIFAGIPMDAAGDYAGVPLIGLITPFTLLTGLLGLAMFLAAGSCWAALKAPLPSCLQARAARLRLPLQVIALALFAVVSVYALVLVGPEMDPNLGILRWLFAALVVVGLLASLVVGKTSGDDLKAFLAQSASMIALVALLACSMFPVLVNATADSVASGHHFGQRRIVGAVAHLDDHHPVHRASARSRVPRGHLPHLPRPREPRRSGGVLVSPRHLLGRYGLLACMGRSLRHHVSGGVAAMPGPCGSHIGGRRCLVGRGAAMMLGSRRMLRLC